MCFLPFLHGLFGVKKNVSANVFVAKRMYTHQVGTVYTDMRTTTACCRIPGAT